MYIKLCAFMSVFLFFYYSIFLFIFCHYIAYIMFIVMGGQHRWTFVFTGSLPLY